jgi:hypothetical protein
VAVGQPFTNRELLYRIANLERVWVLAELHPGDAALLSAMAADKVADTECGMKVDRSHARPPAGHELD